MLAAAAMGAKPWQGQTFGPFDVLAANPGFGGLVQASRVRQWERSDVLDSLLPGWIQARKAIRSGHWPWWNPYAAGGVSAAQNPVRAMLTPAFAAFALAPTPTFGFYLAVLVNLMLAGLGAHLWLCRRLGHLPALFAGMGYMLCGFFAAWLYWPHVTTALWIPWVLLAVDRWWRRTDYLRWVALAISVLLMFLGGFPFVVELGLGAAVLYALCLAIFEPDATRWRKLAGVPTAAVLGALLGIAPVTGFLDWGAGLDFSYRSGGSGLTFSDDAQRLLGSYAITHLDVEGTMYAGGVALGLGLLAVPWALWKRRRTSVTMAFSVGLGAASVALVFGLIPLAWLSWIPGLGSQSWSRAIVTLDLALVVAAASVLAAARDAAVQALPRHGWVPVAASLVILLCLWRQGRGQLHFFRAFNGPVPAAWFYPSTPLIDAMRRETGPFQSVIADDNFLVSGTLGAYGVREWYAHAFKPPELSTLLRQLVDQPFDTATASSIDATDIHLASPLMSAMAVRFVAGDAGLLYRKRPVGARSANPKILPPLPMSSWRQVFRIDRDFRIDGIAVRFATYAEAHLPGTVDLELASTSGDEIATAALSAADLADNRYGYFSFGEQQRLLPGTYALTLRYIDNGTSPLTAWSVDADGTCSLQVDGVTQPACIDFALLSRDRPLGAFRERASFQGVHLLENAQAPSGAYFLPSLLDTPNASSSNDVHLTSYRPEHYTLRYTGGSPGWIVVPVGASRHWRIRVDGTRVKPLLQYGVMPAVRVTGPAELSFDYEPPARRFGPWLTLLVWSCVGAAGWFVKRRRNLAATSGPQEDHDRFTEA